MPPEICPNCGADIPANAKACPECGSDEETGWSEQARYDSLDLPDDQFDYDEFVGREFGGRKPRRNLHWFWWLLAVALLAVLLLPLLRHFFG